MAARWCTGQVMDGMNRHAPELASQLVIAAQRQRRGVGVTGQQPQAAIAAAEAPQDEAAVLHRHHHHSDPRLNTAINHQQITINDAIAAHRIPLDPHEEGGEGGRDQFLIQINARFDIIIGWTGEAGGNGLAHQGAEVRWTLGPQGDGKPGRQQRERHSATGARSTHVLAAMAVAGAAGCRCGLAELAAANTCTDGLSRRRTGQAGADATLGLAVDKGRGTPW